MIFHNIARLVHRLNNLKTKALVESDGACIAGKSVQNDGLGGGGAAIPDNSRPDALILKCREEV